MSQPYTETDPREDGNFTIIMQVGDNKIPHTGTYMEIKRPVKLVFTWESPFSSDGSKVTLEFSDLGENKTRVDLTHVKFIDEQARANHEAGWSNILASLDDILS